MNNIIGRCDSCGEPMLEEGEEYFRVCSICGYTLCEDCEDSGHECTM